MQGYQEIDFLKYTEYRRQQDEIEGDKELEAKVDIVWDDLYELGKVFKKEK